MILDIKRLVPVLEFDIEFSWTTKDEANLSQFFWSRELNEVIWSLKVVEFASRNGRWRVLVDGIHEFGAIMKKPWLHTASSRLNVVMHSPNGKCNKWQLPIFFSFFLSYFVFLISCFQMLALDLQHHNTILVLAVWGGERSIYRHIARPFHHTSFLQIRTFYACMA